MAYRVAVVVGWLFIALFLALVVISTNFLGGYKYVKLGAYLFFIRDKTSSDFKQVVNDFSGTLTSQEISGFYAGYIGKRIWVWTLNGLISFRIGDTIPALFYSNMCQVDSIQYREENGLKVIPPQFTSDVLVWSTLAKPGDYVRVRYILEVKYGNARIVDKIWARNADVWMNASTEKQCGRL